MSENIFTETSTGQSNVASYVNETRPATLIDGLISQTMWQAPDSVPRRVVSKLSLNISPSTPAWVAGKRLVDVIDPATTQALISSGNGRVAWVLRWDAQLKLIVPANLPPGTIVTQDINMAITPPQGEIACDIDIIFPERLTSAAVLGCHVVGLKLDAGGITIGLNASVTCELEWEVTQLRSYKNS